MNETVKILKNRRTIRWFREGAVEESALVEMVDCARLAPSAANMQPLKYKIINGRENVLKIFPYTKWAGYLPDKNPSENDAPSAFILMLADSEIKESCECDAGIGAMSIMTAAESMGLATCMIGSFDRMAVAELLNIKESLKPLYLIAVGYPAQTSGDVEFEGNIKYRMDDTGHVSVPKRSIEEVLV